MTDEPVASRHEQAREWGRELLATAPWESVSDRVTLLVVSPPTGDEALSDAGSVQLWLSLDSGAARSLPAELARALGRGDAIVEEHRTRGELGVVTLAITTDDAAHRLLQATTRRAAEARWQVRHAEAVADRMHRLEQYHVRAGMLPEDGLERLIRPEWVTAAQAMRGLEAGATDQPDHALPAAGEVAAALCRVACAWEEGAYPPVEHLRAAASGTRIGRRIGPWLDSLAGAIAGDESSLRWVLSSRDQVLHEVQQVLGERFRNRGWLSGPEAFALRPPR